MMTIEYTLTRAIPCLLALVFCCSCQLGYLTNAAYHQAAFLLRRENIKDVINEGRYSPLIQEQLQLITQVRKYATSIGMNPKGSFLTYSHTDAEALTWIVAASKPLQFEIYQWYFPIVGTVPYKGFFQQEDALEEARYLEREKGYETYVRGAAAFSSLGWFDDPVATPMLKGSKVSLVSTVLHEIVHTTVWFENEVGFNESFAESFAIVYTPEFFSSPFCPFKNEECIQLAAQATQEKLHMEKISPRVEALWDKLHTLYSSSKPDTIKRQEKARYFDEYNQEARALSPTGPLLIPANNAALLQIKLYLEEIPELINLIESLKPASVSRLFDCVHELKVPLHDPSTIDCNASDLRRK